MINRAAGFVVASLLFPVILVIAAVIRIVDGAPVLFRQGRAGRGGRPFILFKFRTMRAERYPDEPDADRLGRLGGFLRRSSLDELPTLLNVIRGEMNFVGPRPLPVAYTSLYSSAQARRLEVKPGLTGPVQVNGRNALDWDDKFALDAWYVENRSWRLDLRILVRTPLVVFRGQGISHGGHATMPRFTGRDAEPEGGRTRPG